MTDIRYEINMQDFPLPLSKRDINAEKISFSALVTCANLFKTAFRLIVILLSCVCMYVHYMCAYIHALFAPLLLSFPHTRYRKVPPRDEADECRWHVVLFDATSYKDKVTWSRAAGADTLYRYISTTSRDPLFPSIVIIAASCHYYYYYYYY